MKEQPENKIITSETLPEIAKRWVYRLGLSEWAIGILVVRDGEMPEVQCNGYTKTYTVQRVARIYLLDEKDHYRDSLPVDMEIALVHELLHVKWSNIGWQDGEHVMSILEHQLLHDIAKALVGAYRDGLCEGMDTES